MTPSNPVQNSQPTTKNRLRALLIMDEVGSDNSLGRDAADYIERLEDTQETKDEALHKIDSWSRAYPLKVFPEPDLVKARRLLEAGGITLDSISAHCMRHCVEGVGQIARAALSAPAGNGEVGK